MARVKKIIPSDLDVDSYYSVKVRSINSFGVPSEWSEALVVNTSVGFRKIVQTENSLTVFRDDGETAFSYSEIDKQRVNHVRNPSFETGTVGWESVAGSPVSVSSFLEGLFGNRCMAVMGVDNALAGNNAAVEQTNAYAQSINPDELYSVSAYVRSWDANRNFHIEVSFYNAGFGLIDTNVAGTVTAANTDWLRLSISGKAPANAAWAKIRIVCHHKLVVGQFFRVDGVLFEKGTLALNSYFDGGTAAGVTTWVGTPHASTSVYQAESSSFYLSNELTIGGTGRLAITKTGNTDPSMLIDATAGIMRIRDGLNLSVWSNDDIQVFSVDGSSGALMTRGAATITGALTLVTPPTHDNHAATKAYVDSHVYTPDVFTAVSQSAMLALLATPGDYAVRTDVNKTYILKAMPPTTLSNWVEMPSAGGGEAAVAAHEAKIDPHPQYMTQAESDAIYLNASNINIGTLSADRLPTTIASTTTGTAAAWTTTRTLNLAGDLSGSVGIRGDANMTLTATVLDDSHTHDTRYYTESESDDRFVNTAGDTMTGGLTVPSLSVTGDLIVSGTTTTINSTTVTLDDPILTLGGDTAPTLDDNKDRGIEFRYYDSQARRGFFGYDDSTGKFTFLTAATNLNEVFTGTKGEIDALVDWTNVINKSITLGTDTDGNYVGGLLGTNNQVLVSGVNGEGGTRTLSLPQDIHTGAAPTFNRLTLNQATGVAPLTVNSATLVNNLNADFLDGQHATYFASQELLETVLGDLLFVGLYGASIYSSESYIEFPGTVDNILTVPDTGLTDLTGDMCVVAEIAPDDWSPAVLGTIISKWDSSQSSYRFFLNPAGTLGVSISANGSAATVNVNSSVNLSALADGETKWVAFTFDSDNGAGSYELRFWTSDDGATWTQLGVTHTGAGPVPIFAGTRNLSIGGRPGQTQPFDGKIFNLAIRDGIGTAGAVGGLDVFTFDARRDLPADTAASSFVSSSGHTVTIGRSGSPSTSFVAANSTKPKPNWDEGPTTYRHGMYWVVNSEGELDFIDADLSGRWDVDQTFRISHKQLTSNVATLTTVDEHNGAVGDHVFVSGVDPVFDGRYEITAVTAYTISYAKTNADIPLTSVGENVFLKTISDMPVFVNNGDWIIAIDPDVSVNGPGVDLALQDVTFQYIPFSSETYVKSQIQRHIDPEQSPDPHVQYLNQERADARYLQVDANFDSDIHSAIAKHIISEELTVEEWEWIDDEGYISLTVASHNILPGSRVVVAGISEEIDGRYTVVSVDDDHVNIQYDPGATPVLDPDTPTVTNGTVMNDPHEIYLTPTEAAAVFAPIEHEHSYEPLGAVDAHVEQSNPHPQYLFEAEAEQLYAPIVHEHPQYAELDHIHPQVAEVHPTDGAASAELWVGSVEPTEEDGLQVGDIWIETIDISLQPPSPAIGFTVVAPNGHTVNIYWNEWHATETIDEIELQVDDGGGWVTIFSDALFPFDTSFTHTTEGGVTVTENTAYSYRIRAHNASAYGSGWGPYIVRNITTPNDPPAEPTGVSLTAPTANSISLTWTDVSGLTYDVYHNGVFHSNVNGPPVVISGLNERTNYSMGVRAQDDLGAVSAIVSDTVTTPNAPPPAPTGLSLVSRTHNSVTVSWNAVAVPDIKDYNAQVNASAGMFQTTTSRTFTGLSASTSYTFRVLARDTSLAESAWSSNLVVSTLANPDTTPPNNAVITSFEPEASYGRMVIRFTCPTNSDFHSFYIQKRTDSGAWSNFNGWTTASPGQSLAYHIGTWSANQAAYARIHVRDNNGNVRTGATVGYYVLPSPYTISATGSTTWKDVNGGTYNFDGNYRPYMGYVSDPKFNARGLFTYGTGPQSLYYGGKRTITSATIYLKRENCGSSAAATPVLALHQFASPPASGSGQSAPTIYGTPTSSGVSLTTPAVGGGAAWGTVPTAWAQYLVNGTYRGIAIYTSSGSPYICLSSVSENSSSGDIRFYHLG